jgi:hypothetical protein
MFTYESFSEVVYSRIVHRKNSRLFWSSPENRDPILGLVWDALPKKIKQNDTK